MYPEALEQQINLLQQQNAELKQQLAQTTHQFTTTIARLEQELSEAKQLVPFFDISVDMLCIAGFDGYFQRVNPGGEKILGYSQEELLSISFLEMVHPEDRAATLAEMSKLSQGIRVFRFENRYRCKNGSYCWLSWTSVADDNCIFAMARDVTERKTIEEALKQFETKIKFLVKQTPLGIIEWNPAFEVVEWNPAAEKIFGYSAAEMLQQHALEIVPEIDTEIVVEVIKSLLTKKGGNYNLNRNITKDGKLITCEWINTPLLDGDGNSLGIYSMVQNVSDRQKLETALRDSEERFRLATEQTGQAIYDYDIISGKIQWAGTTQKFMGLSVEESQDFDIDLWKSMIHPEDRDLAISLLTEAMAQKSRYQVEYRWQQPNGTYIHIEDTGVFLFNDAGEAYRMLGTLNDISDRKQADIILRQQEAEYRGIFETVNDGISVMDLDTGKMAAVNPAFCEMHGYSAAELLELNPTSYIHPQSYQQLQEFIKTIKAGRAFHCQAVGIRKDGTSFDIEVTGKLFHYQGKPHALSVVRDISERKQIEAQLRQQTQDLEQTLQELQRTQTQMIQSEKMSSLGQLVAGVAHEINNPVNFIHGNVSYLEEHTQDLLKIIQLYQRKNTNYDAEFQALHEEIDLEFIQQDLPKILNSMKVGTQRIRQIVLSLRTFSRMDEAEYKAVDIHTGLDSTLMILQHRLKEQPERPAIQVIQDYGKLPLVECYAGQLNQVFMNILANAIDALEEGMGTSKVATIRISTSVSTSGWVKIAIADNGTGMPENVQKQLFNPFFTTKPVGKGTGMGMSISYQIITEKHKGKLECSSTPGEGTEFTIEIPIEA